MKYSNWVSVCLSQVSELGTVVGGKWFAPTDYHKSNYFELYKASKTQVLTNYKSHKTSRLVILTSPDINT